MSDTKFKHLTKAEGSFWQKHKTALIVAGALLLISALGSNGSKSSTTVETTAEETPTPTAEETPTPTASVSVYEAIRWCAAMEGRDRYLYTYNEKVPSDVNVWDEGYDTCFEEEKYMDDDEFIELVSKDWEGEYGKDFELEGHPLSYYAELLDH